MFDNPQNLFSAGAILLIIVLIIHNAIQHRSLIKLTEFIGNTPKELIDLGKVLAKDVISVETMNQIIQTGTAVKTYTPDQVDRAIDAFMRLSAQLADKTTMLPPELQRVPPPKIDPPEPDPRPVSEQFGTR